MAKDNIEQRRLVVSEVIKSEFTTKQLSEIEKLFGCSYTAVRADVVELQRKDCSTIYPSSKTKKAVFERDNYTCQYCLKVGVNLIADHVIPFYKGGLGYTYNLVAACSSCNSKKKNKTWLPINHHVLRNENPEWHNKILNSI